MCTYTVTVFLGGLCLICLVSIKYEFIKIANLFLFLFRRIQLKKTIKCFGTRNLVPELVDLFGMFDEKILFYIRCWVFVSIFFLCKFHVKHTCIDDYFLSNFSFLYWNYKAYNLFQFILKHSICQKRSSGEEFAFKCLLDRTKSRQEVGHFK